jgi:hypothetical protein
LHGLPDGKQKRRIDISFRQFLAEVLDWNAGVFLLDRLRLLLVRVEKERVFSLSFPTEFLPKQCPLTLE